MVRKEEVGERDKGKEEKERLWVKQTEREVQRDWGRGEKSQRERK